MYAYYLGEKRRKTESKRLDNFIVTASTSAQYTAPLNNDSESTESIYRSNAYYVLLDTIVTISLKERFSTDSLAMGVSVDIFFKLNYEGSMFFINRYQVSLYFFDNLCLSDITYYYIN